MSLTERDELIMQWEQAKTELDNWKIKELELRTKLVEENFINEDGTQNLELGGGWKLKAVIKTNYSFTSKEALDKQLDKLERLGPEGKFVAERIVTYSPKLSLSEYKKLDNKFKKIIDEVVVTKPAAPTLELVAPKVKE